jgi:hypothetical protein
LILIRSACWTKFVVEWNLSDDKSWGVKVSRFKRSVSKEREWIQRFPLLGMKQDRDTPTPEVFDIRLLVNYSFSDREWANQMTWLSRSHTHSYRDPSILSFQLRILTLKCNNFVQGVETEIDWIKTEKNYLLAK